MKKENDKVNSLLFKISKFQASNCKGSTMPQAYDHKTEDEEHSVDKAANKAET